MTNPPQLSANHAPLLDPNTRAPLTSIREDERDSYGTAIWQLLPGSSDADVGAKRGIAAVGANTAHGNWQYTLDNGAHWQPLALTFGTARLLPANGNASRIRFQPAANDHAGSSLVYRAWDQTQGAAGQLADLTGFEAVGGSTAYSEDLHASNVLVTPQNDAPVLNPQAISTLSAIAANNFNSYGTPLGAILNGVTDVDVAARRGVAITSANTAHGRWQYTLNGGQSWLPLGAVSSSQARLLPANGNASRLRFIPAAGFQGTVAIVYVAWDQTQGTAGGLQNLSGPGKLGGATPFSANFRSATLRVGTQAAASTPAVVGDGAAANSAANPAETGSSASAAAAAPPRVFDIVSNPAGADPDVAEANDAASEPSISADGRFVAFQSLATNLVGTTDTNGVQDVFVKDLQTGAIVRASLSSSGVQGDAGSTLPSISANGRYVAFTSAAANLVIPDTNATSDIFVKDLQTGAITLVSASSLGEQGQGFSTQPVISPNGQFAAFTSLATNLIPGGTDGGNYLYVKNLQSGALTLIGPASSSAADFSSDGQYIAYGSGNNVYLRNLQTGVTQTVMNGAFDPSVNADGRYVAFSSGGYHGVSIQVKDMLSGRVYIASTTSTGGVNTERSSSDPSISDDGRYVAFTSLARLAGTYAYYFYDAEYFDIFVKDLLTGITTRVSSTATGRPTYSSNGELSADGKFVVFQRANYSSGQRQIFRSPFPSLLSTNHAPVSGNYSFSTIEDAPDLFGIPITTYAALISDVDDRALAGIAITGVDSRFGTWQYTLDGGANSRLLAPVSAASLLLPALGDLTKIRFLPKPDFNGSVAISYTGWDQTQGTPGETFAITNTGYNSAFNERLNLGYVRVLNINDAPQMISSQAAPFFPINEDDRENGGMGIERLIGGITDIDKMPKYGIAIFAADSRNGSWQYRIRDGAAWLPLGAVSPTAARLLPSNSYTSRIRFLPSADFTGTASISYYAWDQTTGGGGGLADVSTAAKRGGGTAFSLNGRFSTIEVTPRNDAPSVAVSGNVGYKLNGSPILLAGGATINDDSGKLPVWLPGAAHRWRSRGRQSIANRRPIHHPNGRRRKTGHARQHLRGQTRERRRWHPQPARKFHRRRNARSSSSYCVR